jgi:8-oxo-dGTP pyrophosphatase MutT (NUDIX family)/phosphohistidine phosphatase SixA
MGDRGAVEEIHAAGAVVWRPADNGAQVALIHRPRYDDWTWPKGKLNPGEHVLHAAVREVAEETGLQVTLSRRLPAVRYAVSDVPKRVDYWVATVTAADAFEPGSEVDDFAWVAAEAAGPRLSYERDVQTLGEFSAGARETVPLILIRHASAGRKADWPKHDVSRPLDSRGVDEALALADLLRCFGAGRVVSAPAERCVATVRPFAASIGAVVEIEAAFEVGGAGPGSLEAAAAAMARLADDGGPVAVCSHRENLQALLEAACAAVGAETPHGKPLRKSEFAVLHRAGGKLAALERYHPDGDALARTADMSQPELVASAPSG